MASASIAPRFMRHKHLAQKQWWEDLVSSSIEALESQEVAIMNFFLSHVDLKRDLASTDLKLKVQMNGMTHLKTPLRQSSAMRSQTRIRYSTEESTIYEGAEEFCIQLCQPSLLGSSRVIAHCRVSIQEAFGQLQAGDNSMNFSGIELTAVGAPDTVLGHITFDLSIRSSKLKEVGGLQALKTKHGLAKPCASAGFSYMTYATDCNKILDQMRDVKTQLSSYQGFVLSNSEWPDSPLKESKPGACSDDVSTYCSSDTSEVSEVCV